jgi:probable phosphoglycerate mutase
MPRFVYLARHGETDWNVQARWQGHTDIPLNPNGRAQARMLAVALRSAGLAGIVSSDLSRAHETACIVGAELGLPLAYADIALRERSFGVFEGLTRDECESQQTEAWRAWLAEKIPPPGGESHDALTSRVVAAVTRVAERVAHERAPALAVSHGGALRAVIAAATGTMPPVLQNCAVWKIAWDGGALVGAECLI